MEGILFGADNSFNRCIPLNEPIEIRVSGDIDSDCLTGSTICQTGANSDDNLVGTSGNDCINGNSGSDTLIAGEGNDKMNGGDGRDRLIGGDGNDELTGGPGPDTFVCGPGTDKIIDFKPSEGDKKTSDCEQF
jgi:Ca2+-binding RTX toxin-like protein